MAAGDLRGTLTGNANSVTDPSSLTGSVAVSIGDLVFVVFGQQTNLTAAGVTDNLGNQYRATNAGTDAGTPTGRAFYARVTVAGTLTQIDVDTTASTNDWAALAAVIAGPFRSGSPDDWLDANPANITSDVTSPFTCPATGTLLQTQEVVIAWGAANQSDAWSATSPNLLAGNANNSSNIKVAIGYQLVAATTSIQPAFTAAANPSACVLGVSSFRVDPNVSVTPTGVSATGSAGTATATCDVSVALTGVAATVSVGTLQTTGWGALETYSVTPQLTIASSPDATASITGVAATSAVGTLSITADVSASLTGVSSIGAAGDVVATGGADVSLTGVSATGAAGDIVASGAGDATANVTGVAATGQVGELVAGQWLALESYSVTPQLTLTAASGVDATANPTGVSATSAVGTLTVTAGATADVTGVAATSAIGTLTAAAGITVVSGPTWTDNGDGTATITVTFNVPAYCGIDLGSGSPAAYTESALSYTNDDPNDPGGLQLSTTHEFTVPEQHLGTETLSESLYHWRLAAAEDGGSMSYVAAEQTGTISLNSATASLTGVSATGAVGTLDATGTASVSLTGVSATGQVGTAEAGAATNVDVAGVQATGAAGTLQATGSAQADLTGVQATGAAGTPTVTVDAVVSLTGVSASGEIGTVSVSTGNDVQADLTGVAATGAAGSYAVSGAAQADVTGVQATGNAGTITASTPDAQVELTGVLATGLVGTVIAGLSPAIITAANVRAASATSSNSSRGQTVANTRVGSITSDNLP